ncbi:hypothetical protein MKW98_030404 [Papaver atlanticum]|uniref:HAUS augmin-like complex subunit 6 N-terminal domain-containing protein n=1 Tax=Papaver atlanticum TaxID=357466 RepID=A0AAD4XI28_9MAGN|nr:hypothetical protein MKW98_030404 [Papaver atlanticum]
MEREKEREIELESAMYTNCLLLGLDPSVLGVASGNNNNNMNGVNSTTPRVGLFRHSNPKLGEQLLYFILSSLRGPIQSSKDFDKVWPIFDSAQSRDFRKVVQAIINELESQGALPRSNSRVSSLATCCGPRFVELLWQLSLHALREVHRRTFAADVASNPLPSSLTDVAFSHAATLLPVTKARIALERRKFLKNAETAVHRQAMWSNLAHEMTAEFRGLCAEEAYLQQELEKLQDLRNKAKLDGELWDDRVSSSLGQNSHLVSKATRLWESLLARKSQHEVLASGPIEDLIAHREHRYRISGSSLLAAMDQSCQVPYPDVLSIHSGDTASTHADDREPVNGSVSTHIQTSEEVLSRVDDRSGRVHPTVDIAEILRRWTHALQRIHKQSLHLVKANDGEGPELLRSPHDGGTSGHAEFLATTLAEHRQHLASIKVLVNQLKEAAPAIKNSIAELQEEVNSISSTLPPMTNHQVRSTSPIQAQSSSGRIAEKSIDEVSDITSKLSNAQLEKVTASPTLKLPHLFSSTPNSSGKAGNAQRRQLISQVNQVENVAEVKPLDQSLPNSQVDSLPQGIDFSYVQNLRRSVREAALAAPCCNTESSQDSRSSDGSEHYFVPLSGMKYSSISPETKSAQVRSKRLFSSPPRRKNNLTGFVAEEMSSILDDTDSLHDFGSQIDGYLSTLDSNYASSGPDRMFHGMEEDQDQVFSPPLLMDTSLLEDVYEDLLAPLSETDTALMEQ